MTRFLATSDGGFINADDVVEIRTDYGKIFVEMRNGTSRPLSYIYGDKPGAVADLLEPIVAAQSGYECLSFVEATGHVWRDPVIAWRIDGFGGPTPITPEGAIDCPDLLYSNGQVVISGVRSFASEADWLRWKAAGEPDEPAEAQAGAAT